MPDDAVTRPGRGGPSGPPAGRGGPSGPPERRRRRVIRIAAITLAIGCILALWPLAHAGSALVVHQPVTDPDVIISLASHEWERLPLVAALAAEYPRSLVLLTQPPTVTQFNCHDCANRAARLQRLGVAESRVRTVAITGRGTHGEAVAARGFAREVPIRRLLVATSPYHTRRSLAVFRKAFEGTGVEIGVVPALASSTAQPARWWLLPDDRAYVPYEWAALVYYAFKYSVPITRSR